MPKACRRRSLPTVRASIATMLACWSANSTPRPSTCWRNSPRSLRRTLSNSSGARREPQSSRNLRLDRRLFPSLRGRRPYQFSRFHLERLRDPAEHGDARRDVGALDPTDVPGAQPGPLGQFLLRHLFRMTQPTQIDRHDLLEIHGDDGADIGIIVPGTIIPIRTCPCYSSKLL